MEEQNVSKVVPVEVMSPMEQFPKSEIQSIVTQLDSIHLSFGFNIISTIGQTILNWKKIEDSTKLKQLQIESDYLAYIKWLDKETEIRLEILKQQGLIINNNRTIIDNNFKTKMELIEKMTEIISEQSQKGNHELVKILTETLTTNLKNENQLIINLLEKQN
ncbi:MAG: hypothetical protein QNJ47_04090 [Nostocaceae cyanobacterium]|nr:hypothetical protein [Nostocaceae cyanobacterium]